MVIATEEDIRQLVLADEAMMHILRAAQDLELPDWWIGAGFLRSKVWDALLDIPHTLSADVDLVYFDSADTAPETDWAYDEHMKQKYPGIDWEIRNQARMHYVNDFRPYASTADGISHWVETATCVAVTLDGDELRFLFCYGLDDLLGLIARPTPYFAVSEQLDTFKDRVARKAWQQRWPRLKILLS